MATVDVKAREYKGLSREQVMSIYRKRFSPLDQAVPVRKFLCGERLSTKGNNVKPL